MTNKWNMIVDVAKCNGCYNCALAAKDEYVGNAEPGYFAPQPRHGQDWIKVEERERGQAPVVEVTYLPTMCNHCDDAPCLRVAKNGAVTKRGDGIVIIDPDKAKGQRQIVDACPYGSVYWNEELEIPQHWPFDAHLLDRGWKRPRSVDVCATGALKAVKITDAEMKALAADQGLAPLHPEYGTKPRVYYKSLSGANEVFVAGAAFHQAQGVRECAADAKVVLRRNGQVVATAVTDDFGEFKLPGLPAGSDGYDLSVERDGLGAVHRFALGKESIFIGSLELTKAQKVTN